MIQKLFEKKIGGWSGPGESGGRSLPFTNKTADRNIKKQAFSQVRQSTAGLHTTSPCSLLECGILVEPLAVTRSLIIKMVLRKPIGSSF